MKINLRIPGQFCAGLGDATTWAWIANGAQNPIEFYADGQNGSILESFGQRITNDPTNAINPSSCYTTELDQRGKTPRVKLWCDVLGIKSTPKRPVWPGTSETKKKRVVLCPQSHFRCRTWPAAYWLDLNWSLIARGYEVVFVLESDSPDFAMRGPSFAHWGCNFHQVAGLYRSAGCVIANDSFPAHFAGTLGIPTIALCGPTKDTVFNHIDNVTPMYSTVAKCIGCHFGWPYRDQCDVSCQALNSLLPDQVIECMESIIENRLD